NLPNKNARGEKLTYFIASTEPREDYSWDFSGNFKFNSPNQEKALNVFNYKKLNTVNAEAQFSSCTSCGIDSVQVTLRAYSNSQQINGNYIGNLVFEEKRITDLRGGASFAVPPVAHYGYRIYFDSRKRISNTSAEDVGSLHEFDFDSLDFTAADFREGEITIKNVDNVDFSLPLRVADACEGALGDYRFKIRVKDTETGGINYDSTFLTDETGFMDGRVPPYDFEVSVVGVTNPDAFAINILDYFRARSFSADFGYNSLYKGFFKDFDEFKELTQDFTGGERLITFNQTPRIVTEDFQPACPDSKYLILDGSTRENHTVRFNVRDNGCNI
ncbi:MAG: hypothetical protein AAFY41_18975, partial [Bacteroidota bacterium]